MTDMASRLSEPIRAWHFIVSVAIGVALWLIQIGATTQKIQDRIDKVDRLEQATQINSRNIIRIGSKMGVEGLEVPK